MNILYIGAGYVGACSAAISANSGHNTLVYDIDEKRIALLGSHDRDSIESCLFEDGLGDLLVRNAERIRFTDNYAEVELFVETCDAVFMCLPTPEIGQTGESNLTYYFAAGEKLAAVLKSRNGGAQKKYIVIVNKSTVPIDMAERTREVMDKAGVKNYGIVSNPEFLVEGKAITGSMKPDRVVVGAWNETDFSVMRQIYQRFYDSPTVEYIEVNPKEAEAGKLLANTYLFNRLALCFDIVGRTCESFPDVGFEQVRRILIGDERIGGGGWGFYNSLYAGGSCLIKDTRSLSHQLEVKGADVGLIDEIYKANERQLAGFFARAKQEAGFVWKDKTVALLGLSFKRDTNDLRNAPSITLSKLLLAEGVKVIQAYDPVASSAFAGLFPAEDRFVYAPHESAAVDGADVVIIATDWPQFRALADALLTGEKKPELLMDGRRMLQHRYDDLRAAGIDIVAVGSPFLRHLTT